MQLIDLIDRAPDAIDSMVDLVAGNRSLAERVLTDATSAWVSSNWTVRTLRDALLVVGTDRLRRYAERELAAALTYETRQAITVDERARPSRA